MNSTLNEKEFRPMGEPLSRLEEELAKLAQDFVSQKTSESQPNSAPREPLQRDLTADPDDRISGSGWAARGLIGALLAAGIGVAGFIWWGATGEGAKRPPPPPAMSALPPQSPVQQAPVQEASSQRTSSQPTSSQPAPARPALSEPVTSTTVAPNLAPAAAAPADPMPLLQSMTRNLASQGKEIEELKAARELLASDNANFADQLKASQEQLNRSVAGLSEQLKASQEQGARDSANLAEQIKAIQEQLARLNVKMAERDARPAVAAAPPRPTLARPGTTVAVARKPVPTPGSPSPAVRPRAPTPPLPSTTQPVAPER